MSRLSWMRGNIVFDRHCVSLSLSLRLWCRALCVVFPVTHLRRPTLGVILPVARLWRPALRVVLPVARLRHRELWVVHTISCRVVLPYGSPPMPMSSSSKSSRKLSVAHLRGAWWNAWMGDIGEIGCRKMIYRERLMTWHENRIQRVKFRGNRWTQS